MNAALAYREKEILSPDQERIMQRLFAGLPKGIGQIGNSEIPLETGLRINHRKKIPPNLSKKGCHFLKSLLMPEAEKNVVQGKNQPLIFGEESLFEMVIRALKKEPIHLNIGMSASKKISPMAPSYLELGLQRLKELLEIGFQARLRIFSTASLSPRFNGANPDEVKRMQEIQYQMARSYIQCFYQDIAEHIDLLDIKQEVEFMDEEKLRAEIQDIQNSVHPKILKALEACGEHHGGNVGAKNALAYAAYHRRADVFQDEGPVDNLISIGGPGEALFNEVRFSRSSNGKASLGIVVPQTLIAKTPPYLEIPNGLEMKEFIEQNSDRVVAFMKDPKANKHRLEMGGAQNMVHIGRCLSNDSKNIIQGLEKLRAFFLNNNDILS